MNVSTLLFVILVTVAAVVTGGCIGQDTSLSAEEQAQVRSYSDPITDNLLLALNENNYTQYSRDFSSAMSALDIATFEQNRAMILSKIGRYVARGDATVTRNGEYVAASYRADFEQETGVDIRVIFKESDPSHQIYGLWFNSPKLRS
jgi:hypothetical protein